MVMKAKTGASSSHSDPILSPPLASSSVQGWSNIVVESFHQTAPGERKLHRSDEHALCLCLAPRPFQLVQVREGRIHRGLHSRGDITLTPAGISAFEQWDCEDHYVSIRLTTGFVDRVALEALEMNPDQVSLLVECQIRDPQLEHLGMNLLSELTNEGPGGRLYVDSLANLLAIHLLRHYSTIVPRTRIYDSGLPEHQLKQVIDYIHDHLEQDIRLSDLAAQLDMSQFHFSRCFKQSMGMPPHQYLIQQRVEQAKQLLNMSELSIADVALQCGFSSQSHFGQWFRKLSGMTPKAYRYG
jgi:AraC family transcriptional regulator